MSIATVKKNIEEIYRKRETAVYALCLYYAALAINYFRSVQAGNRFWINRTGQAMYRMHADAFKEGKIVGWFMAHGVQYGTYLELANNRIHEAIRPIIQRYAGRFIKDVQAIYKDAA